jgi:P pilus assembly chaperone PapD
MFNKFNILLIFLAAFFITSSALSNSLFIVAPGVLHLNLKKKRPVESFIVRNTGSERLRLRLTPIYYPINSRSMNMGTPLTKEILDDISKNLIVAPRIVSLKPGQKRTIRVAFRKNKKFEPGDYRAHVLVKSVDSIKQKVKPDSES